MTPTCQTALVRLHDLDSAVERGRQLNRSDSRIRLFMRCSRASHLDTNSTELNAT